MRLKNSAWIRSAKCLFIKATASSQTNSKIHLGKVSDVEKSGVRDTLGEGSFLLN